MIKWHTLYDVFEAFHNQSHSKSEIQLACIKGPRNRTFEACISVLIRKCFQRCLNLAYANLWRKKNIPLFYKHVATYKNCPKTSLTLNTERSYITRLRCSACQSQIPADDQCSHLIGLFT